MISCFVEAKEKKKNGVKAGGEERKYQVNTEEML